MNLPAGVAIYFGSVFPLGAADTVPTYVYERRVSSEAGEERSTHITRDPEGEVVFVESATHDAAYGLRTDAVLVDQLGRTGKAALQDGTLLEVRLLVLERVRTMGFTLEAMEAEPGETRVRMRADSALVRMVLDPLVFTFGDDGRLTTLEGRVPPKVRDGERWRALDARVEYAFVGAGYR